MSRKFTINADTVGETIDQLAAEFSTEADTNGLYILERALEIATETRSQEKRQLEAEVLFAEYRERREAQTTRTKRG